MQIMNQQIVKSAILCVILVRGLILIVRYANTRLLDILISVNYVYVIMATITTHLPNCAKNAISYVEHAQILVRIACHVPKDITIMAANVYNVTHYVHHVLSAVPTAPHAAQKEQY